MKSSESPVFHDWMCRQLSRKANLHGRCVRQKSSCYPKRLLAQNSRLMMEIQGKTSSLICKAVRKIHTKSVHAEMLKIMCINKVIRFIKPCVRTPPGNLPFIHHSPHSHLCQCINHAALRMSVTEIFMFIATKLTALQLSRMIATLGAIRPPEMWGTMICELYLFIN